MDVLWTPWRSKYIETFKDEDKRKGDECFFCEAVNSPGREEELLVVARYGSCFAMLNRYPYNNGHVLLAPNRHVGELDELTDEEYLDLMNLVRNIKKSLDVVYQPHGYNVGANLGRTAGAGVPGHLHYHIVPRWNGDTSFMATLDDVKVVSQSLDETQRLVSSAYNDIIK